MGELVQHDQIEIRTMGLWCQNLNKTCQTGATKIFCQGPGQNEENNQTCKLRDFYLKPLNLRYIALHYIKNTLITKHYAAPDYTTLHNTTPHYATATTRTTTTTATTVRYVARHYATLRKQQLQLQLRPRFFTQHYATTPGCNTLLYPTLPYTTHSTPLQMQLELPYTYYATPQLQLK